MGLNKVGDTGINEFTKPLAANMTIKLVTYVAMLYSHQLFIARQHPHVVVCALKPRALVHVHV